MHHVEIRHLFPHPADKIWSITGDFAGLKKWLPGVTDCQVEGSGAKDVGGNAIRNVQLMDGSVTKESLESFDAANMRYRYAILAAKGFDASAQFVADFQVMSTSANQSEVVWRAQFSLPASLPADKVDKAKLRVQQMYQFFLQHLSSVIAGH